MWNIIPYITTPIALVSLVLMIFFYLKRAVIHADLEKLKDLDSKDKAGLLPALEEKYAYKTDDLTQEQRYDLAKSQLLGVAKKRREQLLFSAFIAIIFLIIFILSLFKNVGGQVQDKDYKEFREINKISPMVFNIPASSKYVKLILSIKSAEIEDTIKTPATITLWDLQEALVRNYGFNDYIRQTADLSTPYDIIWSIIHENKPIDQYDKQIAELNWYDFDRISLEYSIQTAFDAPSMDTLAPLSDTNNIN